MKTSEDLINGLFARIEELEAELRTRDNAETTHRITLREVQAETMRLQTKCDRLEADAKRYRWIRDAGATFYTDIDTPDEQRHHCCEFAMDAAIDAAIAKENNQEKQP